MSDDIKLRLRVNMHAYGVAQEAADALEAMAGEVERLKGVLGEEERACEKAIITATKAEYAAAEAEAERDRLKAVLEAMRSGMRSAVAERDRLKAALLAVRQYVRGGPDHVSDDDITAVFRISNDALTEALEAKE